MTAIIIEDESLAIRELEQMLQAIAPEIRIIARLETVGESVEWLRQNRAELIFCDIHLGDGQSFDIFRQVEVKAPVIFITAYNQYALEAFKNQGIAYVLKPFDREELRQAIDKVRNWFGQDAGQPAAGENYRERFLVQIGNRIKSVPVAEVAYFMADGKYLMLRTFDGGSYILDQTMAAVEGCLEPRNFFRINRKFIVSYRSIKEMIRYSNSRIRIVLSPLPAGGTEAIVSSDRIRQFREWLNR